MCPKSYSRKEHLFRHSLFKHSGLQIEKGKPGRKPGRPRKSAPSDLVTYVDIDVSSPSSSLNYMVPPDCQNYMPPTGSHQFIPPPPEIISRKNSVPMMI